MARPVGLFVKWKPDVPLVCLRSSSRFEFLRQYSEKPNVIKDAEEEEFRVLKILPEKAQEVKKKDFTLNIGPPRTEKMPVDQDWTNVWPGIRTFHPAVVPLPVRQGRNKHGPPPSKYGNLELMKIPNFLHLTPPAIKKHCDALKAFCTKWPAALNTEKAMEKHFPIEIISSDYCHSSPSIRDPLGRIISLRVKLKNLNLDKHAKDKFLRLVGQRYDPVTGYVTITTESCPLKKQNYDYANYLLTALYFESMKYEDWEKEKSEEDMEEYIFSERQSFRNVKEIFDYNKRELPNLDKFGAAVEDWLNKGDDATIINSYKKASMELLSLPPLNAS